MGRATSLRKILSRPRTVRGATLVCQGLVVLRHQGLRPFVRSVGDWRRAVQLNRAESRERAGVPSQGPTQLVQRSWTSTALPIVSVVVRTRNRPADLRVALDSLARQTFQQFEVVVVNDGGDDIGAILRRYEGALELRYVFNATANGRSQAVNDGVRAAAGEYVTFLDDDDIVYPFHLATLVDGAGRSEAGRHFVYSHYNLAFVEGRGEEATIVGHQHLPIWSFDRMDLLAANRPPIHTWLLPRATFDEHGGFDAKFEVLHDWDFLLRVTERMALTGLPRETCEYRIYLDLDNSVTRGRQAILNDVRLIHTRHPAQSAIVSLSRKLQIARFEFQVDYANQLDSRVQAGLITRDAAAREYVQSVFGIA